MIEFDTPRGARFIKSDLHVHSPGSYDYENEVSASKLIDAFEEENLELVAVTDHNTTGFYEKLAEESEESSVTVLPGVEITTGQSGDHQIHMTAVFPPEKADDIDNLLYEIGANGDPQDVIADQTIPSICKEVNSFGGLPILAHIDASAGAHHELRSARIPHVKRFLTPMKLRLSKLLLLKQNPNSQNSHTSAPQTLTPSHKSVEATHI